jgi:Tol biopolymer transport system component
MGNRSLYVVTLIVLLHLAIIPMFSAADDYGKIAFNSDRDGNYEIYVMNADGSDQINLSENAADDICPAWSPDGKRVAFSTDRDGNYEIYVMNADGSDQIRLTNNSAGD